jgi:hypothetical protein
MVGMRANKLETVTFGTGLELEAVVQWLSCPSGCDVKGYIYAPFRPL